MKHLNNDDLYIASICFLYTGITTLLSALEGNDGTLKLNPFVFFLMSSFIIYFCFRMALKFFINARRTKYIEFYGSKEELVSQIKDALDIK